MIKYTGYKNFLEAAKAKAAYKVVVVQTGSESNILEDAPVNKDSNSPQIKVESKKNNKSNLKRLKVANAVETVSNLKVTKDEGIKQQKTTTEGKASKMDKTKHLDKGLPVKQDRAKYADNDKDVSS